MGKDKRGFLDRIKERAGIGGGPDDGGKSDYQKFLGKVEAELNSLKTVPHANYKSLEMQLDTAKNMANSNRFVEAKAALKTYKTISSEIRSKAKDAAQRLLDQKVAEVRYHDELKSVVSKSLTLKAVDGKDPIHASVIVKRGEAEQDASKQDYVKALQILRALGGEITQAVKNSEKAQSKALKNKGVRTAHKAFDAVLKQFKPPACLESEAEATRIKAAAILTGLPEKATDQQNEKAARDLQALALEVGNKLKQNVQDHAKGLSRLQDLEKTLNALRRQLEPAELLKLQKELKDVSAKEKEARSKGNAQELEKLKVERKEVEAEIESLPGQIVPEELIELERGFKECQGLFADCRYGDFTEEAKKFEAAMQKCFDEAEKRNTLPDSKVDPNKKFVPKLARSDDEFPSMWQGTAVLRTELGSILDSLAKIASVKDRAAMYKLQLAQLQRSYIDAKVPDYPTALKQIDRLEDEIRELQKIGQAYQDFKSTRDAAAKKVEKRRVEAKSGLTELENHFKDKGMLGDLTKQLLATLQKELGEVEASWAKKLNSASTEDELAADVSESQFTSFAQKVEKLVKEPQALKEAQADNLLELAKKTCQTLSSQVLVKIGELELMDFEAAATFEVEIANLQKATRTTVKEWSTYQSALKSLQTKITQQVTKIQSEQTTARTNLATKAKAVSTAIAALEKAMGSDKKKLATYVQSLKDELLDLQQVSQNGNTFVLNQTAEAIDALLLKVNQAKAEATKTGKESPLTQAIAKLEDLADQLKSNKDLKECLPTEHFQLTQRLSTLKGDFGKKNPAQELTILQTFESNELAPAKIRAQAARTDRDLLKGVFKEAQTMITEISRLKPKPERFVEALEGRLEQARANGKSEGKEELAKEQMKVLLKELASVIAKPDSVIDKEKKAREAEESTDQETIALKTAIEDFFKIDLPRVQAVLKKAGGSAEWGQFEDAKKLGNEAKKLLKKGDLAIARSKLEGAQQVAGRAEANPQGFKNAARGELAKVGKRWRSAVDAYRKSIDAIKKTIAAEAKGDFTDETIKDTSSQLDGIRDLFNPGIFDEPLSVLIDKQSDLAAWRTAREKALRVMRDYRATCEQDPLFMHLMSCPFGRFDVQPIAAALNDLELNSLRGI